MTIEGLNTKNADVICKILKKLQLLVQSGDFIAESLVPYYRQILPVFNLLKNKRSKLNLMPSKHRG